MCGRRGLLLLAAWMGSLVAGARPASALSIVPVDLDGVALGDPVTSSSTDFWAYDFGSMSLVDIGDLNLEVWENAGIFTYVLGLDSAHDHISELNTAYGVAGFRGEAGLSASDAAAAGAVFEIELDPDGTLDWMAGSGTVDSGESLRFFFRSTAGPGGQGGVNIINSLTAQAQGPAPALPEPGAAGLLALAAGALIAVRSRGEARRGIRRGAVPLLRG